MGLLEDILAGMADPDDERAPARPQAAPAAPQQAMGGMSPIMMAILALLAKRALAGGLGGAQTRGAGPASPSAGGLGDILGGMLGGGAQTRGAPASPGGGLGDILGGLLGGASSGATGNVLSGGLGDLIRQLDQSGQGDVARSWVGRGENKPISPNDLGKALGDDTVKSLAEQAGISQIELLNGLSRQMPRVIDRLTPQGRLPTEDEAARWL
jgi:uncharacterized protein YidB (DUF937 family)